MTVEAQPYAAEQTGKVATSNIGSGAGYVGCVSGVMKEVDCTGNQANALFNCIYHLVLTKVLDDFKIPTAANCTAAGFPLDTGTAEDCSIANKPNGDCGTCDGGVTTTAGSDHFKTCTMTLDGNSVENARIKGTDFTLFNKETQSGDFIACDRGTMKKIACEANPPDSADVVTNDAVTCIQTEVVTGLQNGALSSFGNLQCGPDGKDYRDPDHGNCKIETVAAGDCGDCIKPADEPNHPNLDLSAAPIKSITVVAIIALIATLF